jgi:ferritin-like metal-binding protein YciE
MTKEEQKKEADRGNKDTTLYKFFVDHLKDIYWAEKKMVRALPKLSKAANTEDLIKAFDHHLEETKTHVTRLEQVFAICGEDVEKNKSHTMAGILDDAEDIIDETIKGTAQRDVGLIFAGQKAEHYEIATYGGLKQLATVLGYTEAAALLDQTLSEEKIADELLSSIAETKVNQRALEEME